MENRSEALPGATRGSLPGAAERSEVSPRVATLAKEYRSCTLQPIAYVQSRSAHAKLDRKSAHAELDRNRALALVGNELEKRTFVYRCAPSDCLEGELSLTANTVCESALCRFDHFWKCGRYGYESAVIAIVSR